MTKTTINQRLALLAKVYELDSYSKFAERTGLSHQVVSNYLKDVQRPKFEQLVKIKQSFDDVDADWLLTGEGEMFKKKSSDIRIKKSNALSEDEVSFVIKAIYQHEDQLMTIAPFKKWIEEKESHVRKEVWKEAVNLSSKRGKL